MDEYPYLSNLSILYLNRQNNIPEVYSGIKVELKPEKLIYLKVFVYKYSLGKISTSRYCCRTVQSLVNS